MAIPLLLFGVGLVAVMAALKRASAGGNVPPPHEVPGPIPSGPPILPPQGQVVVGPITPAPSSKGQRATVSTEQSGQAGVLNIRDKPAIDGNIVGEAAHGSSLVVTGSIVADQGIPSTGAWYPVLQESTGTRGFCAAEFLTVEF